jgi:hypothetical protein
LCGVSLESFGQLSARVDVHIVDNNKNRYARDKKREDVQKTYLTSRVIPDFIILSIDCLDKAAFGAVPADSVDDGRNKA